MRTPKDNKILDETVGDVRIELDILDPEPGLPDYGILRQSWICAVKLVTRFGAEQALVVIDERAERAADRGDYETARRWRTLITAIHAIQEDERWPGE